MILTITINAVDKNKSQWSKGYQQPLRFENNTDRDSDKIEISIGDDIKLEVAKDDLRRAWNQLLLE